MDSSHEKISTKEKWKNWFLKQYQRCVDFCFSLLEVHFLKIVVISLMLHCCTVVDALHLIIVLVLLPCLSFGVQPLRFCCLLVGPYLAILFLSTMTYQTAFFPELKYSVNCSNGKRIDSCVRTQNWNPVGLIVFPQWTGKVDDFWVRIRKPECVVLSLKANNRRTEIGNDPEKLLHIKWNDPYSSHHSTSQQFFIYFLYYKSMNISCSSVLECSILDPEWWGFHHLDKPEHLVIYYKTYIIVLVFMTLDTVVRIRQKNKRLEKDIPKPMPFVMYPETTRLHAGKSSEECLKYFFNYGFYKLGVEVTLTFCVYVIGFRVDAFSILYSLWLLLLILSQRTTISIIWPLFLTTVFLSILWQYTMAVGLSRKCCYEYPWTSRETAIKWLFLPNFEDMLVTDKILVDFLLLMLIQRQQFVFTMERKYGEFYPGGSNAEDYKSYRNPDFISPYPDYTTSVKKWIDLGKLFFMSWFYRITLALLLWNGTQNVSILSLGYLVGAFVFLWIDFDLCLWKIQKIIAWWNALLLFVVLVILTRSVLICVGCIYTDRLDSVLPIVIGNFWFECCSVSSTGHSSNLCWDIVCFFCIIIQRRLQSKGAKLMDKIHELRMKSYQKRQTRTLIKIKKNMTRIKEWQKRMQGLNYKEPTDHETAIYMGDYFMFEEIGEVNISSSSSEEDAVIPFRKIIPDIKEEKPKQSTSRQRSQRALGFEKTEKEKMKDREKSKSKVKLETKDEEVKRTCAKIMIVMINILNKYSSDYRYIRSVVRNKRRELRVRFQEDSDERRSPSVITFEENLPHLPGNEEDEDYTNKSCRGLWLPLLKAIVDLVMSQTELLCYFVIFIYTVMFPNFISLVLPIMVFLWGSLTTLRPTATFWTVLISYSEVMMVIKTIFQNPVFPWGTLETESSTLVHSHLLFEVKNDSGYIAPDMILLILLFLHRFKLKTLGLWNRSHEDETFPPEDMKVYKELTPENELNVDTNPSATARKRLLSDPSQSSVSVINVYQKALWKCTSRATAKIYYRGPSTKTKILVKEIEGQIIVTHDGRRLQPTFIDISQLNDRDQPGNIVLRVTVNDIMVEAKSLIYKLSWVQYFTPVRKFFRQILSRDWPMSADFYTLMFIFQFINFLIIFLGYSSFANPDAAQSNEYFSLINNQVPPLFVLLVILHFSLIITDRILYLRKCLLGKLLLHFSLVIIVHIWLFIVIPILTEGLFSGRIARQVYYIMSCFYFLMSSYQLRVGYPSRVQGHFLCRKYGYFNYISYKALQLLPFFNQLRTVLDYLCTYTSLSMMEWIKMESMFEVVFENKCSRRTDISHPTERGVPYPHFLKYCPGILVFVSLVVIIWLPFLIFLLFNTVAQTNLPQEAVLKVEVGNFGEIFSSVASYNDIFTITQDQYKQMQKMIQYNRKLSSFLTLYDYRDVAVLKLRQEPFQPWLITPKEFQLFNDTAQNLELPVTLYFKIIVDRIPRSQIVASSRGYTELVLTGNDTRRKLAEVFLNNSVILRLNNALPKFVHITNEGKVKPLPGFLSPINATRRNVTMQLMSEDNAMWWKVVELADEVEEDLISTLPYQTPNSIVIYTFNEKNTPQFLMFIRKRGILGLYLSIVVVTWNIIRRLMTRYPLLMFGEMPDPDPVLQLCKDIYLARENHEFALEEDLYAKLLFLFRSPETMIKVTRLKN